MRRAVVRERLHPSLQSCFAELVVSTSISLPPCSENQPFMTGISSLRATESRVGHRARWGNTDERNHEVVKTAESLK